MGVNNNSSKYIHALESELYKKQIEIDKINRELEDYKLRYNTINNSFSWRLTTPLRFFLDRIKANQSIAILINGLKYLKKNGLRKTILKIHHKYFIDKNLLDEKKFDLPLGYNSVYQDEEIIPFKVDVKVLAFHLPQYHSFPENDEWWGEGFTEWTNTKKALPCYDRHYEPREPHNDIGYYDLSIVDNLKKQADMARRHGLFGFCFYYYWFSGKRLMEKPIDLLLSHPEIDTHFCLCWANENWTRTWDGLDNNVLIEQKYLENDPVQFILDIRKYFYDKRYIKWRGKPVLIIYAPKSLPDVGCFFKRVKQAAVDVGIGDISLWICKSPGVTVFSLNLEELVDKEIEFPPHSIVDEDCYVYFKNIQGHVINYSKFVDQMIREFDREKYNYRNIQTVMLGWDNSARKEKDYYSFDNFDVFKYYQWLSATIDNTEEKYLPEDRYVFINAWNEWGEGTYLEPDKNYGYTSINTTTRAISHTPFGISFQKIRDKNKKSDIFVQVHLFYEEMSEEFISYFNNISDSFDCYITTDTVAKAKSIFEKFSQQCNANLIQVDIFSNKGRDVAPFLLQMHNKFKEYSYFLHVHSKKSTYDTYGNNWRFFLLNTLLGSNTKINYIVKMFNDNPSLGIVFPKPFSKISQNMEWGGDYALLKDLMQRLNLRFEKSENDTPVFPAGNMFWAKTDAVRQLLAYSFTNNDFPNEAGQIDGTIMHAIERSWVYIADANGYQNAMIDDKL